MEKKRNTKINISGGNFILKSIIRHYILNDKDEFVLLENLCPKCFKKLIENEHNFSCICGFVKHKEMRQPDFFDQK